MTRKKEKVSAQDIVTAMLKAEVEAKEKDKPDQQRKRRTRKKKAPEVKQLRVTRKLEKERQVAYDLVCAAWKNPSTVEKKDVAGYIRGIVTVERRREPEVDVEHVQDLMFLAMLWQYRQHEVS